MPIERGVMASTGTRTGVSCGWIPSAEQQSKQNMQLAFLTGRGSFRPLGPKDPTANSCPKHQTSATSRLTKE